MIRRKIRILLVICLLVGTSGSLISSSQGLAQASNLTPHSQETALASSEATRSGVAETAATARPTVSSQPMNVVESRHNTVVDYHRNETLEYQRNDSIEYQDPGSPTPSVGHNKALSGQGANPDNFGLGFWADDCVATFNYAVPAGCSPFVLTVSDLDPSWRPAVLAAAQTWGDVGTKLRFISGNITEDMRSYDVTMNGHSTQKRLARGEVRVVLASQIPANARPSSDDVGTSINVRVNPAGYMVGVLVVLNDVNHSFSLSGTPGSGQYDLQSIALHELGHSMGLAHNNDPRSVMVHGWIAYFLDRIRRTPHQIDIDNVITLYGPISPLARPDMPLLLRPGHNELVDPRHQRFEWQPTPSVTGYYFQLSTSQQFTALIANVAPTITNPSFNFNLTSGTRYYWRVKARNFDTNSPWSEIRSFVAGQAPLQTGTPNVPPTSPPPPIPTATSGPQHVIQLYDEWHYIGGYGYVDQAGNYELGQGLDDAVSSLYLQPGWSVRLFEGHNQTGASLCMTASNDDFGGDTFEDGSPLNDRASSFALYNQPSCPAPPQHAIQLYDEWHYNGGYGYVDQTGNYELGQGLDDAVSSLYLQPGWSVRLFEGHNQTGASLCMTASNDDFGGDTFEDGSPLNDRVSSFSTYQQESCPTFIGVELFDEWYYGDQLAYFLTPGIHYLVGNSNNAMSSIRIRPGWAVRLFERSNTAGPSICRNSDDPDFGWDTFDDGSQLNDRVSSIILYQADNCPDNTPATATPLPLPTASPIGVATSTATAIAATPTACTGAFVDVPQTNTFYSFVHCLACRSIIGGYTDNTFRPNNDVTRGQLSKIVANAANFNEPVHGQSFTDVAPGSTFYEYIERMAARSIIGGYSDGTFRPNSNATRGQISKIVANAAGFVESVGGQRFTDVAPGATFYDYIERLAARGIMGGYSDGSFRPNNDATRGQVSKIVAGAFFPNCQTQGSP